jgi:hypothetical protein
VKILLDQWESSELAVDLTGTIRHFGPVTHRIKKRRIGPWTWSIS